LGSEDEMIGNRGVVIVFLISTAFALSLLGQLFGGMDLENKRCRNLTQDFHWSGNGLILDEEGRQTRDFAIPISPNTFNSLANSVLGIRIREGEKVNGLGKALVQAAAAHRASAAADLTWLDY
jgi:hypothetical protein